MRRLVIVALFAVSVSPALIAAESPLWGQLQPGPYPVGFRAEIQYDTSRAERPLLTLEGKPSSASPYRPIEITIWYPARAAAKAKRMTFGDYMTYADDIVTARADDRPAYDDSQTRRKTALHGFATYAIFGDTPESAWQPLLASTMLAVRDAAPAQGRFPVILQAPGAHGSAAFVATTCEYLASHGYVVMSAPSRGLNALNDRLSGGAFYESQARDLEFVLGRASKLEYADANRAGVLAFSRGGAAALITASRDSRVGAIAGWDTGAVVNKPEVERLRESPFWDPDRVTIPLLVIRAGNPGTTPPLYESTRFAPRYWINLNGVHHVDFSLASMIHAELGLKNEFIKLTPDQTRAAFETTNVATLRFFDSFLKSKGAFVTADLQPADIVSSSSLAASPAPPSSALLLERIYANNGIASARSTIAATRVTSPQWRPFPEGVLDQVGGRMIELGRSDEAVQVFELNTDLFPESARAWSALGSAQEKFGRKEAAVTSFRKAVALDPKNEAATNGLARLQKSE